MNRTNVQRTIDYLRALPPEAPAFNMGNWFSTPEPLMHRWKVSVIAKHGHECGTSACLAGHIAFKFRDEMEVDDIELGAAQFLDLTQEEVDHLFFARFRRDDQRLDEVTREQVIAELERMLATDEDISDAA